jgi:hypothetical protein
MISLQFPWMRAQLVEHIRGLAAFEYQKENWTAAKRAASNYDEFDEIIHFLFDDTVLERDTEAAIGTILYDKREVLAVKVIVAAIDAVLQEYGILREEEYLDKPEWMDVVAHAATALPILEANGVGSFE